MAQSTVLYEGAFSSDNRTAVNNNFSELYSSRTVGTGAASLTGGGVETISSATTTTFALAAPSYVGVSKYLDCVAATANVVVSTTAAACTIGLASSSKTQITFTAADQVLHLIGETLTKWIRVSQNTSLITVTT